jgi:hypothetical protein
VQLLWGTACLFVHPRFAHGAATSCNADVFAYAAAQVKKAIEVTHTLKGAGYVFWGGREGYSTLLNTDLKREMDHLGKFLHMAADHKKAIGFKGQFYIEPKPKEPTKHQYDSDAAACLNFLREYDLLGDFKLNLETNHATLAGHTMQHELEVAIAAVQAPFFLLLLTQVSMKAMPVQPSSTLAYLAAVALEIFAGLPFAHVGLEAAMQAREGVVERFGMARRESSARPSGRPACPWAGNRRPPVTAPRQ